MLEFKREEREWQREEARRKSREAEAETKSEERRREEAQQIRKAQELRYRIPMAWIGAVMTVVPLIWTLRTEQDRYEKTMAERDYNAARSEEAQLAAIDRRFSSIPFLPPRLAEWCQRPEDEEFLKNSLIDQVGQIIILEGPSGTGKSALVKKILAEHISKSRGAQEDADALHTAIVPIHYDLRPETPPSPDHFLYGFLRASGYVIEPPGTEGAKELRTFARPSRFRLAALFGLQILLRTRRKG